MHPRAAFVFVRSNSGHRWKTLYAATQAGGRRSYVYLPGLKTRFLRLELDEPSAGAAVHLQSFEFSRSIHAFWHHIADTEARGWHPRWLHREQSVWTPIGTSHGTHCALMNDDGMVEVDQGSFSIEPMLWIKGRLFTWTDVTSRQELLEDWMPVPSVIWETGDWCLRIQAEATVSGGLRVRYRFQNLTDQAQSAKLFVLLRPFQVTPPWQSFRKPGRRQPDPRLGVGRTCGARERDHAHRADERAGGIWSDALRRWVHGVRASRRHSCRRARRRMIPSVLPPVRSSLSSRCKRIRPANGW